MKTITKKKVKRQKKTALAIRKPEVVLQKVSAGQALSRIEEVLVGGDLAVLKPDERFNYYLDVCKSLQLNPLTQPFGYISIDGKMMLYAKKDCAEQLRKIHGVSVTSLKREFDKEQNTVTVDVTLKDKYGKVDAASGSLYLMGFYWKPAENGRKAQKVEVPLKGQDRANAVMKCETKAKRRGTLSICGLSMPDESEVLDIKDATVLTDEEVATATGIKIVKEQTTEKVTVAQKEKPIEEILKALPNDLKTSLVEAGYDDLVKAGRLYRETLGDLDAMREMCKEKIRRGK